MAIPARKDRSDMALNGKTAIVTGAAGGMGRAICDVLAANGANVAMVDISADGLAEVETAVKAHAVGTATYAHSVGDEHATESTVADVARRFGGVDILVNGAGIGHVQDVKVADVPIEVFDVILNVNLRGAFLFCKFSIPHMLAAGGGAIVNISSAGAMPGIKTQGSTAYRVSKTGMLGLTRAVAAHYAEHSIRCTSIAPGPTDTHILWEAEAKLGAHVRAMPATLPRVAQPSEIAELVRFLVDDTGSFMTGGVVAIDGGLTLV
jgi:NAD(P)-dependent dehydrogenase (short-subunit alcohol dehydrogenase family)